MEIPPIHDWPTTVEAATELQQQLRQKVTLVDCLGKVKSVAGVDAGFEDKGSITRAAAVVLSFPDLQVQQSAIARCPTQFPYIPGFLSFREVPALLEALRQLTLTPDLILCDGQGLAHPRRFGLACHLGVLLDIPTIGVAKSRLLGEHEELPNQRGAWQPLIHQDEIVGAVVRSRTGTKPLYVSPGHRVSLETAIEFTLRCAPKYRLPETTRQADKLASRRAKAPLR